MVSRSMVPVESLHLCILTDDQFRKTLVISAIKSFVSVTSVRLCGHRSLLRHVKTKRNFTFLLLVKTRKAKNNSTGCSPKFLFITLHNGTMHAKNEQHAFHIKLRQHISAFDNGSSWPPVMEAHSVFIVINFSFC